jgi:hypothetical protein
MPSQVLRGLAAFARGGGSSAIARDVVPLQPSRVDLIHQPGRERRMACAALCAA